MKNNNRKIATTILVVGLVAFVLGIATNLVTTNFIIDKKLDSMILEGEINTSNLDVEKVSVKESAVSTAVDRVYNSVVMIENHSNGNYAGSGSGFVYKTDDKYGYIMTNHHVIESATNLYVMFSDGDRVSATLLGSDEYLDIAVVRVDKKDVIQLAPLGKSSDIKLADNVFAIGTPVGEEYFNTVTSGIVSGLNRKVTVSVNAREDWVMEVIQVDAAINPGNSGGPLFNASGEVIGVNSIKLVDSSIEGMGFAIKIEDALLHTDQLEAGKAIERPLLGINLISVGNSLELLRYGISIDPSVQSGVVVITVIEDSGASKSDLKRGDVIIEIEGQEIENAAYLKYALYKYSPGEKIKLTYLRDTIEMTTEVTLTKAE